MRVDRRPDGMPAAGQRNKTDGAEVISKKILRAGHRRLWSTVRPSPRSAATPKLASSRLTNAS